jgi:hypothetical protein
MNKEVIKILYDLLINSNRKEKINILFKLIFDNFNSFIEENQSLYNKISKKIIKRYKIGFYRLMNNSKHINYKVKIYLENIEKEVDLFIKINLANLLLFLSKYNYNKKNFKYFFKNIANDKSNNLSFNKNMNYVINRLTNNTFEEKILKDEFAYLILDLQKNAKGKISEDVLFNEVKIEAFECNTYKKSFIKTFKIIKKLNNFFELLIERQIYEDTLYKDFINIINNKEKLPISFDKTKFKENIITLIF